MACLIIAKMANITPNCVQFAKLVSMGTKKTNLLE